MAYFNIGSANSNGGGSGSKDDITILQVPVNPETTPTEEGSIWITTEDTKKEGD